jgi:hypothetical protein
MSLRPALEIWLVSISAHRLQPVRPLVREKIRARYEWRRRHFHQAKSREPTMTSLGVRPLFFVGCHSAATSGSRLAKEFPSQTLTFSQ